MMIELMNKLEFNQTLAIRFSDGLYRLPKALSDTYIEENNRGEYRLAPSQPLNNYLIKHRVIKEETFSSPTQFEAVHVDDESIPSITDLWGRVNSATINAAIEHGEFVTVGVEDVKVGWLSRGRVLSADELREIADYLDTRNQLS